MAYRRPKLAKLDVALRIYYENPEIGDTEIMELFKTSRSTANRLKVVARTKMHEKGVKPFGWGMVNTKIAFEAWNFDIIEIEKSWNKMRKLGFL